MFCSIKDLNGYALWARDGEIGHSREAYFDDERWVLRHLVAETGRWLAGRPVLISPHSVRQIDPAQRRLEVSLTRQQVQDAPGIESDRPVSRQQEISHYDHYGYPYYWNGPGLWGLDVLPTVLPAAGEPVIAPTREAAFPDSVARHAAATGRQPGDPHLRSSAEVIGYQVAASDGAIGHIADFLFDDRSWQIRYAVVDTHNWLPDRLVLVSPAWITSIDWKVRQVRVKVSRDAVKTSPAYEPGRGLSLTDEQLVQRHYTSWLAAAAKARDRFVDPD